MITVNKKKLEYEEQMTVSSLLKKLEYVFPLLIVKINNRLIDRSKYDKTQVCDNDNISIIHLMSGG